MRHRGVRVLLLVTLACILSACGDDGAGEGTSTTASSDLSTSSSSTSMAPSSTSTSATASTIPAAQCNPKTDPAKPALPAETFYAAWRIGDKACAQKLGTPAAVDALFELQPNGPAWEFQGCTDGDEPESGDCAFTYEGGATHFTIVYSATQGWSITKVSQIAD